MKTLTEMMLNTGADDFFVWGARRFDRAERRRCRHLWTHCREQHGLAPGKAPPILTRGKANHKLGLASQYTVGLTLESYVQKMSTGLVINACPNAGHCVKVCIIKQGRHAQEKRVQQARKARGEFFALWPAEACFLLGWELADEVERHGALLFRPNVNSDVEWEKILPSLTSGAVFGDAAMSYGYTKLTYVLDTNGWLDSHYRVAYSWNETSAPLVDKVHQFILDGGSVAMVTSRKKGEDTISLQAIQQLGLDAFDVVDADLTDEWIFQSGVIGDLSAKGKARSLIGKSDFIVAA
jgi:hypothetical protein